MCREEYSSGKIQAATIRIGEFNKVNFIDRESLSGKVKLQFERLFRKNEENLA